MFGLTVFGDFVIGAASFVAGWYFAPYVQKAVDWAKAAVAWVKAKV